MIEFKKRHLHANALIKISLEKKITAKSGLQITIDLRNQLSNYTRFYRLRLLRQLFPFSHTPKYIFLPSQILTRWGFRTRSLLSFYKGCVFAFGCAESKTCGIINYEMILVKLFTLLYMKLENVYGNVHPYCSWLIDNA